MKTVLITGGAGFIGSHLADYLLERGLSVRTVDNLSTGSRANIMHLEGQDRFEFIQGDICNRDVAIRAINGVDTIYHLAASVGVKHIMGNLVSSIHNNIAGTQSVLEAASHERPRVLIASTSEVYGRISHTPSKETDDLRMGETIKSRWSYACSKALDEYLAFSYFHEREVPVTIVRLFNTVGERQSSAYGMVIPTFVRQALAGEPITIHGDGNQSRCFGHVFDVVRALSALMEIPGAVGEVFNIGNPEQITINEVADRIITATNSKSSKSYIPYAKAYTEGFEDAQSRVPDISKVRGMIGFKPRYELDDIIESVIAWQRSSIRASATA